MHLVLDGDSADEICRVSEVLKGGRTFPAYSGNQV